MIAVTAAPSATAFSLLLVSLSSRDSSLPLDARSRPSPIWLMPNRNMARPPSIVRTEKISILLRTPSYSCFLYTF